MGEAKRKEEGSVAAEEVKFGKVGDILYVEVVSPKNKTREFSFHPSLTNPELVLSVMQGRPWKERSQTVGATGDHIEGTKTLPLRRIFDAQNGDKIAVVGVFDVTAGVKEKSLIVAPTGADVSLASKLHI